MIIEVDCCFTGHTMFSVTPKIVPSSVIGCMSIATYTQPWDIPTATSAALTSKSMMDRDGTSGCRFEAFINRFACKRDTCR